MKSKDQTLLEEAYQSITEGGMPPTAGAASRSGANPGVHNSKGEPISDDEMQEALAILNQYAQGDITNTEAAKMFKDLYEKGVSSSQTPKQLRCLRTFMKRVLVVDQSKMICTPMHLPKTKKKNERSKRLMIKSQWAWAISKNPQRH